MMFIGFDYGIVNCLVVVMWENIFQLLMLENGSVLLFFMFCVLMCEVVSEWFYCYYDVFIYSDENQVLLCWVIVVNCDEDIEVLCNSVQFGFVFLQQYVEDLEEVYFVKLFKFFFGVSGLKLQQVVLFEDLVCVMMLYIKLQVESQLFEQIDQVVIGWLINFQGFGGDEVNVQVQGIFEWVVYCVGFCDVVFQFELVVVGFDFEVIFSEEKWVLVVDIGGGIIDCFLLLMGLQWWECVDCQQSLFGYSGCCIGGNDFDIVLVFKCLMFFFGMGGEMEKGIVLLIFLWWNVVVINDVLVQSDFYSIVNGCLLNDLLCSVWDVDKVVLLLKVWCQCFSYCLVCSVEESKIVFFSVVSVEIVLLFIQDDLVIVIVQQGLEVVLDQFLICIMEQVWFVFDSSQIILDVIYFIGGSVCLLLIKKVLVVQLLGILLVGGDDFGLVIVGLVCWVQVVFCQFLFGVVVQQVCFDSGVVDYVGIFLVFYVKWFVCLDRFVYFFLFLGVYYLYCSQMFVVSNFCML